jgi:hypothetical protein
MRNPEDVVVTARKTAALPRAARFHVEPLGEVHTASLFP